MGERLPKSVVSRIWSAIISCMHFLHALGACNWVVGGRHGAANRLEMKRTSLVYRMKKLGITRPSSLSHKNAIAGLASHE